MFDKFRNKQKLKICANDVNLNDDIQDLCRRILNHTEHQPEIYPTERNSIQFQYSIINPDNSERYIEIEFMPNDIMVLYVPKRYSDYRDAVCKVYSYDNFSIIIYENIINRFFVDVPLWVDNTEQQGKLSGYKFFGE